MTTVPMTPMLAAYERYLRDLDRAEATIETYMPILGRMDRDLPCGVAYSAAEELAEWIEGDGTRASATRELYRAAVAGFGAWASSEAAGPYRVDYDAAEELPYVKVRKGTPRPITDEALRGILAGAPEPVRTWYLIASHQGARCVEISRLDREDVTQEYTIFRGKGDKDRVVPTHPLVWAAVRDLPSGPMAVSSRGERLHRKRVQERGNVWLRRLGFAGITMHRLRHWFGTAAYEASGHDILAVKALLGHADLGSTLIYVASSQAGRLKAVAGLPTLVPPTEDEGDASSRAA